MKTEVTYRGGSGAQGTMEVVVDCGKCGGNGKSIKPYKVTYFNITETRNKCWRCNGTGRERTT